MSESQTPPGDDVDIAEEIINLEAKIAQLKQRHEQIERDKNRQRELEKQKQELKAQLKNHSSKDSLKSEVHFISKELEEIELRLESELFKWSSLSEPFWQIIRFGGVGVVIGWILKSLN